MSTSPHRLLAGEPIPAFLSSRELRTHLGYGRTKFWRLEKLGAFDHLLAEGVVDGVRVYSGTKLAARLIADAEAAHPNVRSMARHRRERSRSSAAGATREAALYSRSRR